MENTILSALKNVRLIKFFHREDYGNEIGVKIFNTGKHFPRVFKNRSVLQASLSWNDYGGWPYLHITSGGGKIFGLLFIAYKFGFDLDLLGYTWAEDPLSYDEH